MGKSFVSKLIITTVLLLMLSTSFLYSGTFCEQSIELIGKTDEDTSRIYYYEFTAGECDGYAMFELTISSYSLLSQNTWYHGSLTFPCFSDSLKARQSAILEPALRLFEKDGDFGFKYKPHLLSTPKTDYEENKIILDSMVMHGGPLPKKIDSPDFNVDAELIYSKPGGVYINYEIQEAYLFRKSGVVFIVTHQPRMMTAYDTLHGVLIYKIKEDI